MKKILFIVVMCGNKTTTTEEDKAIQNALNLKKK